MLLFFPSVFWVFFQIVRLNRISFSKLPCHLTALILASWRRRWWQNSKNKSLPFDWNPLINPNLSGYRCYLGVSSSQFWSGAKLQGLKGASNHGLPSGFVLVFSFFQTSRRTLRQLGFETMKKNQKNKCQNKVQEFRERGGDEIFHLVWTQCGTKQ